MFSLVDVVPPSINTRMSAGDMITRRAGVLFAPYFLSMGEKLFAIPFSAFKYDLSRNEYVLDVSKERLETAPGFDPDHWPSMSEEIRNRDVYKYYNP